jgi:hypothetical protein
MEEILRPVVVIPDKDPVMIEKSEAISALNVRLGNYNPKGGTGVRKVLGNLLLANPLLPIGTNKVIGGTKDPAGRLLYLNWNSNGLHAIYCYDPAQPISFQKVLEGPALVGLLFTDKVSMDFDNGYLVWTSKNIEEPRQIDVARGINTFLTPQVSPSYLLPIEPWETYQIQRVPKVPLEAFNSTNQNDVRTYTPKPEPTTTNQGYQLAYNYEFINNIEGRLSPPTPVLWNPSGSQLIVDIPASEVAYLTKGGVANPYIVAIRIYFRVGNGGEWTYFKRLLNIVNSYGFGIYDFATLSSIGVPSIAALLGADGVTRRVDDLLFADSRQVHSRLISGYTFDPPTAILNVANQDNVFTREFMSFAPLNSQQVETALVFFDEQDRIIGGRILPVQTLTRADQVSIDLKIIRDTENIFFTSNDRTFAEVWDWLPQGLRTDNSMLDTLNNPAITVNPTGTLPSPIAKVMLATKAQKGYSSFLRTQCRVYAIYKYADQRIPVMTSNNESFSDVDNNVRRNWIFYGIAFDMNSEQPINFSNEQNYHIQVRGASFRSDYNTNAEIKTAFFEKDFKIDEQQGSLFISKQSWADFDNIIYALNDLTVINGYGITQYYNWGNIVADVILYSKNNSDKPWQLVPTVSWNRNEWAAGTGKRYYGDAYITNDLKTMANVSPFGAFNFANTNQFLKFWPDYGKNLSRIICQPITASMNLNGIYQEFWDSNVGNTISIDENPIEKNLLSFTRHGEQYLLGTQINNIFAFNPLNEDNTQSQLGPITKCVLLGINDNNGNNLYYICENGVEMIFLGRTQQVGTDGNSVMSLSTKVFGSHNVLRLPYGAQNKFDVTTTDSGVVYYVDNRRKILVQISGNGQDPISVQKNFQSDMQLMGDDTIIGFDPLYKEVVIDGGFQSAQTGLAYNMKDDSYQGLRDFVANSNELFLWNSLGSNQKMFGFSQGELYEYNVGYEFFGLPYGMNIAMVVKANPDVLKRAGCMEIMSTANSTFFVELLSYTPLDNGATNFTTIPPSDFKLSEGNQFAVFKNSLNSKGGKFNGLPMHGYMYKLTLFDSSILGVSSLEKQITFVKFVFSEANTNQR